MLIYPANTAKMPLLIQDPDAVLDHRFDWSAWLAALHDTLHASTWSAPGLTLEADSLSDTVTTVFLSGGEVGETYTVTNHITTEGGREDDRSFKLKIMER